MERFIDSLKSKRAQKVLWVLRLIEEKDSVPARYFKKLVNTENLWEVRVDFGSDTFRLLGFFDGNIVVVLVHGLRKKRQKLSRQDITVAQERRKEYFRRKRHE